MAEAETGRQAQAENTETVAAMMNATMDRMTRTERRIAQTLLSQYPR